MISIVRHIRSFHGLSFIVLAGILLSISNPSWAEITKKQPAPLKLTAIILTDSPPTYFLDSKTGKPAGFAVDIMDKVAELSGLQVNYIFAHDWTEITNKIKSGKAALSPGMGISEERDKYLSFTYPIDAFSVSFFVRSSSREIDLTKDGHTVGIMKGSVAYEHLKTHAGLHLVPYESFKDGLFDLLSGQIDAFACPSPTLLQLARESGVADKIKITGSPITEIKRAIAARRGDTQLLERLNKTLEGFVGQPEYQRIYIKWYGKPVPYWTVQKIATVGAVLGFLVISILVAWRYFSIRRLNEALVSAQAELERRVEDRTFALGAANTELEQEMGERIHAEDTLREKNLMLQTLIHAMPDMVFFKDSRGRFLMGNKIMEESLGLKQENFAGKSDDEMSPPDVAEACKKSDAEAIKSGKPTHSEECYSDNNGDMRFLDVVKSPICDAKGNLLGLVGVGRDVTDRKRMEKVLRESEERYHLLFDQSPDGILLINATGKIIEFNDMAHSRLGYTRAEFAKLAISDLDAFESPDEIRERIRQIMRDGRAEFEVRHRTKEGEVLDTHVIVETMMLPDSQVMYCIWHDVTDRKKAQDILSRELAFQSAIGEISEAFLLPENDISAIAKVVLDKAMHLTKSVHGYVSELDRTTGSNIGHALTEMMGGLCRVTEKDRSIAFPKGPLGYNALWGHSLNSLEAFYTNSPPTHSAFKGCCPPGHVPVERFLSVPALSAGQLIGQIALANSQTDYTQDDLDIIKRLASIYAIGVDRKRMESDIRRSIREKETLLREIHHRVKNNLAVVSSLLALQANNINDPTLKQILEESRQRVKSMALVHEKLYHTKNFSAINFKDYITTILQEIMALNSGYCNKITRDIDVEDIQLDLESAVPCGLIINELLTNVCKYAFPDNREGVLYIGFLKNGDTYTLTVKDNGVGLPEGFDCTKPQTFGLQIVNALSKQLRGNFQVKSDNGTDAVLTFTTTKK